MAIILVMRRWIAFILLPSFFTFVEAQNHSISDSLVIIISKLQSKGDGFYSAGMFPSQRVQKKTKYRREDDNIFFTSLIALTLQQTAPLLSPKSRLLADSIINRAIVNYPAYKNKDRGNTYNFWHTNPSKHFPNDKYFSKRKKFIMPDDFDDTAIIYASLPHNDSIARQVKAKMGQHTNLNTLKIRNTFKKYRNIKAYSTWFGKKMPIDFDLCVHLNTMYFIHEYGMSLNEFDKETLKLISSIVEANEHIRYPEYIAPHYQQRSVILYHFARLLSKYNVEGLSQLKPKIISDIKLQLSLCEGKYDRILLETSLLKLGAYDINMAGQVIIKQDSEYYFFVNNFASTFPNVFKKIFGKSRWLKFYHICQAYNACLELEHELFIKQFLDSR